MCSPATIRVPARRRTCCACCRSRACEISRATAPFTVTVPGKKAPPRPRRRRRRTRRGRAAAGRQCAASATARRRAGREPQPTTRTFPAGSLHRAHGSAVQPHRRHAARLSVLEPERSAAEHLRRHGLDVPASCTTCRPSRVTDVKVLDAAMEKVDGDVTAAGRRDRHRHRLRRQSQRRQRAGHAALPLQGRAVRGRRRAVRGRRARSSTAARSSSGTSPRPTCRRPRPNSGLQVVAPSAPRRRSRRTRSRAPRVAMMHTWLTTQTEGWWRQAFDDAEVPYDLHQHAGRRARRRTSARSST